MNFLLDKEHQAIFDKAKAYSLEYLAPITQQLESSPDLLKEKMKDLAEQGFYGLGIPIDMGGKGYSYLQMSLVYEGLAHGSGIMAFLLQLQNNINMEIATFYEGIAPEILTLVPDLACGNKTTAFALTEGGSGCDPSATEAYAELDGDVYRIHGTKDWITNAKDADYFNVMVKDGKDSKNMIILFVPANVPGLRSLENRERMIGNGMFVGGVEFDNCVVPKSNLLSAEGFKEALKAIDVARVFTPAIAIGVAQQAVDSVCAYLGQRESFGKPILTNQGVQWQVAEMTTKIEAARCLLYKTAAVMDSGEPVALTAAMNKLFATDVAMEVTVRCAQLFGAEGLMKSAPIVQAMALAKMLQVIDGTTEIQKIVVGRSIARQYLPRK
ncbi:acyl-CoA dehydrogenase family protein [Serratia sp. DD3]|uniref:acyl-CoA dehydrogenase family protein n=1 Tax=Serratia sp. DD3 TaxID=1410619 RepID=UPI0003C5240E|nr:acyl-CoA dehydrogenase family protein [Serratia sp. DD3]KEY60403.1 acyl-CoA dehydrogenase [Serratia sp. DD3]